MPANATADSTTQAETLSHLAGEAAWRNNPAWIQLLGLCPLLAVSTSVANALGLALASSFVLLGSSALVAVTRPAIATHLRLPAYVLIIATFTTCVVLLMQAFAFELYERIALFVQIIVTNCMILGRIEQFASRAPVHLAAVDAAGTALGFALALLVLGSVRELLATGYIGVGLDQLFGAAAAGWYLQLLPTGWNIPVAALPPGAFIVAGLLLGLGKALGNRRFQANHTTRAATPSSNDANL